MSAFSPKQNTASENHGKNKKLTAVVSVCAVLAVLLIVFLVAKNSIFSSLAGISAEKENYRYAVTLADSSSSEKAQVIKDYSVLRIEINKYYPLLTSEFNLDKIRQWSISAKSINDRSYLLSEELSAEIMELDTALSQIISCCEEYEALKPDILDMMDVFNEINRLHTKDTEGKNTAFTAEQERQILDRWNTSNGRLLEFITRIPDSENIYLINFLAKEAQGEIAEINKAINSVAQLYGETALVRFGGDALKQYPDIFNSSGERVNLLKKEEFESFVYTELCAELVHSLAGFYTAG
ncbi:MAG: hypothetical protein E7516_07465 [Ruminococcaceae bacterium]|nr:hypothetical protein [Oscillospiraceae bacterium]